MLLVSLFISPFKTTFSIPLSSTFSVLREDFIFSPLKPGPPRQKRGPHTCRPFAAQALQRAPVLWPGPPRRCSRPPRRRGPAGRKRRRRRRHHRAPRPWAICDWSKPTVAPKNLQELFIWLWLKKVVPKWHLGKWKQRLKRAYPPAL